MLHATNSHSQVFKIKDASSYDTVSEQFEVFTQMLSLPFVERMTRLAKLQPADRILDIGTGTGIVAFNAARAVPKGRVVAVDLSEGMLANARTKARRLVSATPIEFRRMDAESLELEDQSFDTVLSLFALLHFPNPSQALAEMFRMLRPGGCLVVAVGGGPAFPSLAAVRETVRSIHQLLLQQTGKLLVAPGFLDALVSKHLPGSIDTEVSVLARTGLRRTNHVLTLARGAGFRHIQTSWHGHQAQLETAEDFWLIQSTFSSLARKRLAAAPQEKLKGLHEEFFEICHQVQARGGRLVYPMGAFFLKAQKPSRKDS